MTDSPKKAVLLLHGIRDFTDWVSRFKAVFEEQSIQAESLTLGWISLWQFIAPGQVYDDKKERILSAIKRCGETADLTIIAHSFGTWLITRLLSEHPEIKVRRLILCNSVVPTDFEWNKLSNVTEIVAVNGNRDIWPCLGEILSSRFSATGTRGVKYPGIRDCYFDIAHGGALTPEFCKAHFLPLVLEGKPIPSGSEVHPYRIHATQYINRNRVVLIPAIALFLAAAWYGTPTSVWCVFFPCSVELHRIEDFSQSQIGGRSPKYVRDIIVRYLFNFDIAEMPFEIPKSGFCETRNGVEVTPKEMEPVFRPQVFNVLDNPLRDIDLKERGDCKYRYTIPVRNRTALVRTRYTGASDRPLGSGLATPVGVAVRHLTMEIVPPPGMAIQEIGFTGDPLFRPGHARVRWGLPAARPEATRGQKDQREEPTFVPVNDDSAIRSCARTTRGGGIILECNNVWLLPAGDYFSIRGVKLFQPDDNLLRHPGDFSSIAFSLTTGPSRRTRKKRSAWTPCTPQHPKSDSKLSHYPVTPRPRAGR